MNCHVCGEEIKGGTAYKWAEGYPMEQDITDERWVMLCEVCGNVVDALINFLRKEKKA